MEGILIFLCFQITRLIILTLSLTAFSKLAPALAGPFIMMSGLGVCCVELDMGIDEGLPTRLLMSCGNCGSWGSEMGVMVAAGDGAGGMDWLGVDTDDEGECDVELLTMLAVCATGDAGDTAHILLWFTTLLLAPEWSIELTSDFSANIQTKYTCSQP